MALNVSELSSTFVNIFSRSINIVTGEHSRVRVCWELMGELRAVLLSHWGSFASRG